MGNFDYTIIGSTHVISIDPKDLTISAVDCPASRINHQNCVNGGFFWHYENKVTYPLGILVSEGRILSNRQPHDKPAGTLIVYKNGKVALKELLTINNEKDVWFAVSGCSILPKILMRSGGFTGRFADIGRICERPIIGYNSSTNKIIIAVRANSNIGRAQLTAKNLNLDFAITLDAGGSTNLRVRGKWKFKTTRRLHHVITW